MILGFLIVLVGCGFCNWDSLPRF